MGKNYVPTIHVKDLARMVKKVYETKPPLPDKQYIFAIDNTRKPTQKRLIAAISNGIGTGLLESVDYPDHMKRAHPKKTPLHLLEQDWRIPLMLNLRVRPSTLFVGAAGEGEDAGDSADFNWHCKAGLATNIQTVKEEFCKKRGLRPVKIAITGPPGSGKSFYGKQLSDHYNVPHIHLQQMIHEIENWNKEKEEGILKRREVKARIKQQEEQLRLDEERKKAGSALTSQRPGTAASAASVPPEVKPEEDQQPPKTIVEEEKPDTDSDDEYQEIDIKKRLKDYRKQHHG